MRRLSMLLVLLLVGLALPASAGGGLGARSAGHKASGNFYFGRVAFEDDVIGIALRRGGRTAEVFVTDAEPGGNAEWFEGRRSARGCGSGPQAGAPACGRRSIELRRPGRAR